MRKAIRILGRLLLLVLALAFLAVALFHFLRWRGYILLPQEAAPRQWEVFGVDVSVYQGEVDWAVLAGQGVDFAFIKATEGSSLQDVRFAENWTNAQAAGVRVGAYHFFSYDSPGETQADNFIDAVPVTPGALPPVVDIEFYGDNLEHPPEKEPSGSTPTAPCWMATTARSGASTSTSSGGARRSSGALDWRREAFFQAAILISRLFCYNEN